MTIKKEIKTTCIYLINDEKNFPIKGKGSKTKIREKSFPNNFIFEFDEKIFVSLYLIKDSTLLEFNHNLIWVGVKLFKFCVNRNYEIINPKVIDRPENIYLGWCLGNYNFLRFKSGFKEKKEAKLLNIKDDQITDAKAISLVRDLINTPANIQGPSEFQKEARKLFSKSATKITEIKGNDLMKKFPLIYNVGKGAEKRKAPIFSEFVWESKRKKSKKNIVLIGKGVCFDTGGLNLKLGSGMNLMKKDMGGAANCLGLTKMLIEKKIDINLKLLLPLVENSLSSKAMRPSDIIKSRKGLYIEVGDTDAEGRLILADALTYACESKPDLIIDMATLTGASRVALGTDVPTFFSNNEIISEYLIKFSNSCGDPVWQLPLWKNYSSQLKSNHADTSNIGNSNFGGAITAALFLEKFVNKDIPWIHIDLMAWSLNKNLTSYIGGEAMGIRSLLKLIEFISKN
jgi:leucyl aminopeptidase